MMGIIPCRSETNVGYSNTAKNEERRETGKRQKPVEDHTTVWSQIDECQAPEEELKKSNDKRTTLPINVREYLWAHACSVVRY
jgi:hypothetical protein